MKLGAKSRLLALSGLVFHITKANLVSTIQREGLKLNHKATGLWRGKLMYAKPSIFVTRSNTNEIVAEVMFMLLSRDYDLAEWSEFTTEEMTATSARFRILTIDLRKVPGAALHQDPLNDDPDFKYLTVPVPPEAIVTVNRIPKNWRD